MGISLKERAAKQPASRNWVSGVLVGLGFIAFFDEAVFHQLLNWHHFYDRSTTAVGLASDGLFHAFSWFATIGGFFLFSDLRRRSALVPMRWWGGFWLGAGAFQLYDGTVQHKWMRIHQIRYVDNLAMYDAIWNGVAVLTIALGAFLLLKGKQKRPAQEAL